MFVLRIILKRNYIKFENIALRSRARCSRQPEDTYESTYQTAISAENKVNGNNILEDREKQVDNNYYKFYQERNGSTTMEKFPLHNNNRKKQHYENEKK